MSSVLFGIATLCKYSADFLKLRKDRKSSEKNEAIRDYLEACRRRDHAEVAGRLDLLGEQQAGFEQLLSALWDLSEEQGTRLLEAIEQGNLSVLSELRFHNETTHAKLDRIMHLLRVEPRRLFPPDPASKRDARIKRFEAKYLERANKEFNRLEMLGVPNTRDFHQDLDVAYVNLELAAVGGSGADRSGRAEEIFTRYRQLTIRGPAGSGKTTLLRWIGLKCAQAVNRPDRPWQGGIPLFVPLRKLRGVDRGRPDVKRLHEYAFESGSFETAPNGWLQKVFEEGRAVLLLDGLDELPAESRKSFWGWLNKLLQEFPAVRAFVTSRPLSAVEEDESEEWQPSSGFNHAELRDLSSDDRKIFIERWHEAVKAVTTDPQRKVQLDQSRAQLLANLQDRANAHVHELCKNPQTAGLICALFWRKLKLPETRRELYEASCDLLMIIRDESREITPDEPFRGVKKSDRFYLVECLAWEMMQNARADEGQNIEVREQDARAWLRGANKMS